MTTHAQQIAKDNALVAPENRSGIGKCNFRIDPKMKRPKETTYQVVLDALSLTTSYLAFLIMAKVPVIYMHQFWDTVYKHSSSYRFKIDNKKFAVNVEEFKEILDICPRIEAIINKCLFGKIDNKDAKKSAKMYYRRFTKTIINHYLSKNPSISMRNKMCMHTARDDTILGILKFVSKNEDVQVYGTLKPKEMRNPEMLSSESFQTYCAIATGAEPPKSKKQRKADSSKSSEETPTRKSPKIKRSAKVSHAKSKKKAPTKADTGKSQKVLSEVILLEEAQLKEVLRRSKQDFHSSQASGSGAGTDEGTGTKLGVPDVPKQDSVSEAESWGDSDDEDDDDEDESENDGNDDDDNDGDDDDNDNNVDDDDDEEEEENADECVPTPEDMDFSDKEDDEEKNEEEEDAHVTLTSSQKTKGQTQSSSVSSDFTSKLLNLENMSPTEHTLASVMDTSAQPISTNNVCSTNPDPSTTASNLPDFALVFQFNQRVFTLEQEVSQLKQADKSAQGIESIKIQIPTIVNEHLSTRLGYAVQKAFQSYKTEFEKEAQAEQERFDEVIDKLVKEMVEDKVKGQLIKILPKKIADFATSLIESTVAKSYENVVIAQSSSQPTSTYEAATSLTEFELKKILLEKMEKSKSYLGAPEHEELYDGLIKSYGVDKALLKIENLSQETLVGPAFDLLKGTCKSFVELEYYFKEVYKAMNDQLDLNNLEGNAYLFDLSKPLPLIQDNRGHQVILVDNFIKNDLLYLQGGSASRKYMISTTKTKADTYDNVQGIKVMVPNLWSPTKVPYDIHAL
ncbi:hypothetical protein Tco_1247344 [Tanacetum coccineum]